MPRWERALAGGTEAARNEQPAVVYAVSDPEILKKYEAFNKIDPKIQVQLVHMTGAVATERFKAEHIQTIPATSHSSARR